MITRDNDGTTSVGCNIYLYAWNPAKWTWDDLQEGIACVNRNGSYKRRWGCGNTKKVAIGDEFLFVRLGVGPKGLIGCGYVCSIPYEEPHWDQAKRAKGMTARYTDIVFTVLSESPLISLDDLQGKFPNCSWTPQRNCVQVADSIGAGVLSILHAKSNQ